MLRRGCSRPGRAGGTTDNNIMALSKVCRVTVVDADSTFYRGLQRYD